jgi:hypothetical protein
MHSETNGSSGMKELRDYSTYLESLLTIVMGTGMIVSVVLFAETLDLIYFALSVLFLFLTVWMSK